MSEPTILLTGKIRNWVMFGGVIHGEIYDDSLERFPDGHYIHTSRLTSKLSDVREGNVVATKNSYYYLDRPAQ